MPIRNTLKQYDTPAYYHIYNRGASNIPIFLDDQDRLKFLSLFIRHLDPNDDSKKTDGTEYDKYDLYPIAYCLMGNHFHLLVFQETDPQAVTQLMRSVATASTMYFNRKYKRYGQLFQSVFKVSRTTDEPYLLHITRYVHMDSRNYLRCRWSSLSYYLSKRAPAWLHPELINDMSPRQYREFLMSYKSRKTELELLKNKLADS